MRTFIYFFLSFSFGLISINAGETPYTHCYGPIDTFRPFGNEMTEDDLFREIYDDKLRSKRNSIQWTHYIQKFASSRDVLDLMSDENIYNTLTPAQWMTIIYKHREDKFFLPKLNLIFRTANHFRILGSSRFYNFFGEDEEATRIIFSSKSILNEMTGEDLLSFIEDKSTFNVINNENTPFIIKRFIKKKKLTTTALEESFAQNADNPFIIKMAEELKISLRPSPYQVLGLTSDASQKEIKKAYRKMALEHHPDKGGSEENFKKIQAAYEKLTKE